jgi:exonuclease III
MKAFSVASWNVEHFKNDPQRVGRVVAFLNAQAPDVFALYEVQGSEVFQSLVTAMPGYTFHITEGREAQEILLGVRQGLTAFFTQKLEFQSGVTTMRPGALLTITQDGQHYPLLFLHTASGNDPRGLGLRDDMLKRACHFRSVLAGASGPGAQVNYIFLGDFNLMGMIYSYLQGKDISAAEEKTKLAAQAKRYQMRLLDKNAPATWSNGSTSTIPPSDLDQVVASKQMQFTLYDGVPVSVRGWPKELTPAAQDDWIGRYSDHALLYFEVQKTE